MFCVCLRICIILFIYENNIISQHIPYNYSDGVLLVRFDDSLTFYNAHVLTEFILSFFDNGSRSADSSAPYRVIVIDCDRILSIDATALFRFEEMVHQMSTHGERRFLLANVRKGLLRSLQV